MKTVVGFLSRAHGLDVLQKLVENPEINFLKIFTHRLNPKSQDTSRTERFDYISFKKICEKNKIPLISIDSKNQEIGDLPNCDFIIEVSWRYLINLSITRKAKIAAFGIHRGKLPEYAGAEPIKQALLKNEKEIILSAHYLEPKIDGGETIDISSHPVKYNSTISFEENVQRLREEITPSFSPLVLKVIKKLETTKEKSK